jgi:diguanylate cyclase (GGDEF)-like protein/PAS domain S-box-containing protein
MDENMRKMVDQAGRPENLTGFAQFSVIYNDAGQPSDCVFMQVNPAFETLFSLKRMDVIGKTLSEVLPQVTDPKDSQLPFLMNQVIREGSAELEQYCDKLQRKFDVLVFSSDPKSITAIFSDRTEQNKAPQALKDANERFMQLFNAGFDAAIIVRKSDGCIVEVNSAFLFLSRFTRKELVGKSIADLGLFTRSNAISGEPEQVIDIGKLDNAEVSIRRKNGRTFDGLIRANALSLWGCQHICIYIRNVSIDKQSDQALVISEENYRRLFEAAKDGILILDAENGEITSVNPFLINLLGYSEEEFLKKCIWDLGVFKDILANRENFLELQSKEYIRYENLPLETADGRKVHVEFVSNVYLVGNRKVIQCNIRDITERKLLEAALEKEKRMFEITLISVGDGVISCDNKSRIIFLNRAAELLTEWPLEEAKNQTLEHVFVIVDEFSRRASQNIIDDAIENANVFQEGHHVLLISKYGIERSVEYTVAPIIEDNGAVVGSVLVFRDFSDKRREEKKIEFLSYHDQLTGLYNRRFYEEELRRLDTKRNLPLAIVMGDVNGLKLVNDSFGHTAGDALLMKVASVMQKGCRADDILARLGGDEFIIILPQTDASGAESVIQRIKDLLIIEKVGTIDLSVSFGYEIKQQTNENMQEIFKNAEDHLYRHKLYESLSMRSQTISLVLNTLFEKNQREMMHSKRVGEIAELIAVKLGLSEEDVRNMKTAGSMHDIGKIGIDEAILNKPSQLTDSEREEMQRHPEIGYRILSSVSEFSEIAVCILEHHERWDGTGYPRGLKGNEICLEARILAIADAYDAMTSNRTYHPALNAQEALAEIHACEGTQFDPKIVRLFTVGILGETKV